MRVVASDGQGNEFDPAVNNNAGVEESNGSTYWVGEIPVFPRRGKEVHLRLLANEKPLAELKIPNPAPRPYPTWNPSPLPTSATENGLEVTLARFIAHHTSPETSEKKRLYSRTECVFTVHENTHETRDWVPVFFEVSDATGNHWRARSDWRFDGVDGGNVTSVFSGALWPGETAWKLRVEFKRVANFPESDLLRIPKIHIPAASDVEEPGTQYLWNAVNVQVAAVIGTDVDWDRIARLNTERKKGCITVVLTGPVLALRKQLIFVAATDDQGRLVKLAGFREPGVPESPVPFSFVLQPPDGARELNLVVAVSQSRFLEFLARPEQVRE
jgi:hypothetical protein